MTILPDLSEAERRTLLDEAILDVWVQLGNPETLNPLAQEQWDVCVDRLFRVLCARAREAKAPRDAQLDILERRMMRMPGWQAYLGTHDE